MPDDVDLYREPEDVLRRELSHLKKRLKQEEAELARYEELVGASNEELENLLATVRDDVAMTKALVKDFRAALKAVKR